MTDHSKSTPHEDEPVSKSHLKREMLALQDLGEALVELPDKQLATIPIPDELLDQIHIARKIIQHGGKRRQLQYIGKIMRKLDITPIQNAFEELQSGRKSLAREFQGLEKWRERLITDGMPAIEEFLKNYPEGDRQQLRQMVRTAQKELSQEKPPATSRKLFRYIRELADQENEK